MKLFYFYAANKDPVAKMLGDRFANTEGPDTSTYRYMEEIIRASGPEGEEGESTEKTLKMLNLKLLMSIKDFDNDLLKEAIQTLSTYVIFFSIRCIF